MVIKPKRRKSKDNPYVINNINNNEYNVSFTDSIGKLNIINIDKELFDTFNQFELDDLRELNEKDNHRDFRTLNYSEYDEIVIFNNSTQYNDTVEEIVENKIINEELYNAINSLSCVQKNRIKKYFFEDKTLQQIADDEECSCTAVKYSIDKGIDNLKKKIKF